MALKLRPVQPVLFAVSVDGQAAVMPGRQSVQRLFGILGRPPKSATLKEIREGIQI